MVHANELRIGNNVINPATGEWLTVLPYLLNKSMIDDVNSSYIPIPLTPEVLVDRCACVKCGDWFILKTHVLSPATINISLIHNKTTFGNNEEYDIKHIEYLHNLQNLHFDLSGEELEIKELQNA